jgi:hypothetical protein
MQATKDFQFCDTDLPILQYVFQLRLATIDHIAVLVGRSYKQTAERLARLEEHRYLAVLTRRPNKHVYAIGRDGVPALIEQGYAPKELAGRRIRHHELKELGIKHAVFIATIHVKLLQLAGAAGFTITKWVEGSSLWDRVTTSNSVVLPIRPDALFTITWPDGKGRAHFFLEADRGTMAHSRMKDKITGYAAYFQQQRHIEKYDDMKVFRVATITETRGRADGLTGEFREIMQPAWLAAYPVISIENLTLKALMPELGRETKP